MYQKAYDEKVIELAEKRWIPPKDRYIEIY
jgi:hypothetical protein